MDGIGGSGPARLEPDEVMRLVSPEASPTGLKPGPEPAKCQALGECRALRGALITRVVPSHRIETHLANTGRIARLGGWHRIQESGAGELVSCEAASRAFMSA